MQKKSWIFLLGLASLNFVSAAYAGTFNLRNLFYGIDGETIAILCIFIIFFAFLNFTLSKMFKGGGATAGVMAFATSVLATYGLTRTNFSPGNLFRGVGINIDNLTNIIPFIVLAIFIILGIKKDPETQRRKFKLKRPLIILGTLFIAISFTNLVFEKGALLLMGIIMLVVGLLIGKKMPKGVFSVRHDDVKWKDVKQDFKNFGDDLGRGASKAMDKANQAANSLGRGIQKAGRGIGKGVQQGYGTIQEKRGQRMKDRKKAKRKQMLQDYYNKKKLGKAVQQHYNDFSEQRTMNKIAAAGRRKRQKLQERENAAMERISDAGWRKRNKTEMMETIADAGRRKRKKVAEQEALDRINARMRKKKRKEEAMGRIMNNTAMKNKRNKFANARGLPAHNQPTSNPKQLRRLQKLYQRKVEEYKRQVIYAQDGIKGAETKARKLYDEAAQILAEFQRLRGY